MGNQQPSTCKMVKVQRSGDIPHRIQVDSKSELPRTGKDMIRTCGKPQEQREIDKIMTALRNILADTVAEAICVPVELRGKLPTDYGLSLGIMWYFLGGFGIIHNQSGAEQNRVMKWASAA